MYSVFIIVYTSTVPSKCNVYFTVICSLTQHVSVLISHHQVCFILLKPVNSSNIITKLHCSLFYYHIFKYFQIPLSLISKHRIGLVGMRYNLTEVYFLASLLNLFLLFYIIYCMSNLLSHSYS
jgi:hypothetical protein